MDWSESGKQKTSEAIELVSVAFAISESGSCLSFKRLLEGSLTKHTTCLIKKLIKVSTHALQRYCYVVRTFQFMDKGSPASFVMVYIHLDFAHEQECKICRMILSSRTCWALGKRSCVSSGKDPSGLDCETSLKFKGPSWYFLNFTFGYFWISNRWLQIMDQSFLQVSWLNWVRRFDQVGFNYMEGRSILKLLNITYINISIAEYVYCIDVRDSLHQVFLTLLLEGLGLVSKHSQTTLFQRRPPLNALLR